MDPQSPPPPPYAPPPPEQPGQWPPGSQPPAPVPSPVAPVPYTPMPQQPPAKSGSGRRGLIAIVATVVVVAVIAGAFYFFRDSLSGDVFSLKVGDCIDLPSTDEAVSDVQHQPCTSAHDAEVFLNLTDPTANGAAFPGSDSFRAQVVSQCVPAATAYLGTSFDSQTDLDVGWFRPTQDSWDQRNDRGITCYLYRVDNGKLNKSVKGAGASPL
jgi:hypothetical protein